jgi:hypothetical protein
MKRPLLKIEPIHALLRYGQIPLDADRPWRSAKMQIHWRGFVPHVGSRGLMGWVLFFGIRVRRSLNTFQTEL